MDGNKSFGQEIICIEKVISLSQFYVVFGFESNWTQIRVNSNFARIHNSSLSSFKLVYSIIGAFDNVKSVIDKENNFIEGMNDIDANWTMLLENK